MRGRRGAHEATAPPVTNTLTEAEVRVYVLDKVFELDNLKASVPFLFIAFVDALLRDLFHILVNVHPLTERS
jgi:hypothetical protein